jgi:predicted TIM-barrel fold metal-dependent hydrolase
MHRNGIIDVHAHMDIEAAASLPLATAKRDGRIVLKGAGNSAASVSERLELMDEAGVRFQILSPPPAAYSTDPTVALQRAQVLNDGLAKIFQERPARFAAFASLPLPDIAASLQEMVRALDELQMVGVTLMCFCNDQSIADSHFEPIFEELNRRSTILFLHPCVNGICSPFLTQWALNSSAGPPMEDTIAALHLIARSIPQRFSKIRIVIPHLGGVLPMLLARLDHLMPKTNPALSELPSATARRFWFDTVSHGSNAALRCALDAFGAERLLCGSDFPYLTQYDLYRDTVGQARAANLPDDVVEMIYWRNAEILLRRE